MISDYLGLKFYLQSCSAPRGLTQSNMRSSYISFFCRVISLTQNYQVYNLNVNDFIILLLFHFFYEDVE